MTLNDFVAYIQFLTAFYISLGFERLVDKIFFSDSYRRKAEELFNDIQKQLNVKDIKIAELNDLLNKRINENYYWVRRLSFFAFLFCLLLLLLAGLEPSYPYNDSVLIKNSWLGKNWLFVILGVSLPLMWIGSWALYRRLWKVWWLKESLKKRSADLLYNVSCCLQGKLQNCDKEFTTIVLQSVQNGDLYDDQLISKAKDEYAWKVFEELKRKI